MHWAELFPSLIGIIALLGVVIAIWIGLVGLGRTRRGVAWWLMASGAVLNTIGPIALVVGIVLWSNAMSRAFATAGPPRGPTIPSGATTLTIGGSAAIPIGMLLFGIGFAIHGMRAARTQERVGELEQLTQAMDEEIYRLKQQSSRP